MSLVSDLRATINPILALRDTLGAAKNTVALVTRTWSGDEPGDGTYTDIETPVSPSPSIMQYSDNYGVREGGAIQMGDLKLKWISKQSFPDRSSIDCSNATQKVEKFYKVGSDLYRLIQVEEKLLCWNVIIRKVTK